jgi:AAA domain
MLIDADQLDTSPPEWLVEGMIPRVGIGFWYGPRWTGKSLATDVELALAVGNGTNFFGRKTVKGTVIVGLGEGLYDAGVRKFARIAREEQDRVSKAAEIAVADGDAAAKAWLDEQPAYTDENVKYLTKPFALANVRNAGESEITRSLRAFIVQAKKIKDLELVILDSLSDFTGDISISNDTSANRVIQGLKAMARELNCFILCVAHPTQKGDKMLGAERLGNAADFVAASKPEDKDGDGRDVSTVTCEKSKYGGRFEPFSYAVEVHEWWEPVLDEYDDPTGEVQLASSATIRQLDTETIDKIKIAPLDDEHEPWQITEADDGRPRKRRGTLSRGGQLSEQSKLMIKFVSSRPEGATVSEVAEHMGMDEAKVNVYLSRAAMRGDIIRVTRGLYGPRAS